MRILAVSDLHYTLRQLDWVVAAAADYDLVVVAGDHLDIASAVAPTTQIAVVLEYFARMAAKTAVVACSGNHDLNSKNEYDERSAQWLERARDLGVFVDGMRFETEHEVLSVCPWWDGPLTREVVDRQLSEDAVVVGDRRWIWVYHAPPEASPTSWTGKRHYGDADLSAWIERFAPDIVLCGHVHQAPFADGGAWIDRTGTTVVTNAGRQRGPVPTYLELDTCLGLARWSSLDGIEGQAVARPST